MNSPFIEKLARAAYERRQPSTEEWVWDALKPDYIATVRAILQVMREPTREMCIASTQLAPTWDDDVSKAKWQAMIDTALSEKP